MQLNYSTQFNPTNNADLPFVPDAIFVGIGGHISMTSYFSNETIVWNNVQSGSLLNFSPKYIHYDGTTARNIILIKSSNQDINAVYCVKMDFSSHINSGLVSTI